MKRCIRCWRPRRNARSSRWCPSSTTATGVGSGPMGGILWTMWTHAVRSYPILDFFNELFQRDMTCATTQLTSLDFAMGYIQPWSPTNFSLLTMELLPAPIALGRISWTNKEVMRRLPAIARWLAKMLEMTRKVQSVWSFQTCSCDVELAACIAASGHCPPPLLQITQH